jgi:hypothetical protein
MDSGTVRNMLEFHFRNKFEKLVHLFGFIIRKFVTMHGHMNLKLESRCSWVFPSLKYISFFKIYHYSCLSFIGYHKLSNPIILAHN